MGPVMRRLWPHLKEHFVSVTSDGYLKLKDGSKTTFSTFLAARLRQLMGSRRSLFQQYFTQMHLNDPQSPPNSHRAGGDSGSRRQTFYNMDTHNDAQAAHRYFEEDQLRTTQRLAGNA